MRLGSSLREELRQHTPFPGGTINPAAKVRGSAATHPIPLQILLWYECVCLHPAGRGGDAEAASAREQLRSDSHARSTGKIVRFVAARGATSRRQVQEAFGRALC